MGGGDVIDTSLVVPTRLHSCHLSDEWVRILSLHSEVDTAPAPRPPCTDSALRYVAINVVAE